MSVEDDARRLKALDRKIAGSATELSTEDLGAVLIEYLELRGSLRKRALYHVVVSTADEDVAGVLRRIGGPELLPTDGLIRSLATADAAADDSGEPFSDDELESLGSDLFHAWTSHVDYVRALAELRPLVLSIPAPAALERLLRGARDCYSLQQYDAMYGLCRSAVESAARDIAERHGLFRDPAPDVRRVEPQWWELRDQVASGPLVRRLRKLYGELCNVVHAKRTATSDDAHAMFHRTVEMIEDLYAWNGL